MLWPVYDRAIWPADFRQVWNTPLVTTILLELIIIFVLIVLNGVFSMSETAVVSSRKARLQQAADEGDKRAQTALKLAETPNRFLATVQIGITLIGILMGVFGGATLTAELAKAISSIPALAPYSQAIAGLVVVFMLTFFALVLGELVPKQLALNSPERVAGTNGRADDGAFPARSSPGAHPRSVNRFRDPVDGHQAVRRAYCHGGRDQGTDGAGH